MFRPDRAFVGLSPWLFQNVLFFDNQVALFAHYHVVISLLWNHYLKNSPFLWEVGLRSPKTTIFGMNIIWFIIFSWVNHSFHPCVMLLQVIRWIVSVLTHWSQNKMAYISQTTFSNVFSSMKMFAFWLKFHWSLFLRVQLTKFQHWVR